MVVTCENCSARYKLDDNRISGRGAKITCPRCRHVFVVYKDSAAVEGRVAVGGGVLSPPNASGPAPTPVMPADDRSAVANAEIEVDALDFRKVGIQAWKVKVKIGLVYDFSDYRTLARYIAEGRVTSSDKLSYDGSEWTEISEIPDLAAHFVSVYRQLEAEQAAADAEDESEDYEDDEPTNIMGMGGGSFEESAAKAVALTSFSSSAASRILPSASSGGSDIQSAMSAALDAEESPGPPSPKGPRFIDPFEKRKAQGRRPKSRSGGSSGAKSRPRSRPDARQSGSQGSAEGGSSAWLYGLLLVAAAGGGWWYYNQTLAPPVVPAAASVAPSQDKPTTPREDIVAAIEADLAGTAPEEPVDDSEEAEDDDAWAEDDSVELIPIGPRGPVRPTAAGTPTPSSASTAPTSRSAREYAVDGDAAFQRRDYRSAGRAFREAVKMEPSNSYYNGRLGAALVRSGEFDAAMGPLTTAASGGHARAFVYLGDAVAQRGDTAGAIGHYQSYLATNPRDAQAVQAKIDRLSGS
jgi:predicted Zn finger-like uncharacterized protein